MSRQLFLPKPLDVDIGELDRAAVALQGNRTRRSDPGQLGVVDDGGAVEHDGQPVAPHRDGEAVPPADTRHSRYLWVAEGLARVGCVWPAMTARLAVSRCLDHPASC